MNIDVRDIEIGFVGVAGEVTAAALAALVDDGARIAEGTLPDILLAGFPLVPEDAADTAALLAEVADAAAAMARRGHGRIVLVLSAVAAVPMRRHPAYSVEMAAALAAMRTLAMAHAPAVLVNAVGVGVVGNPPVAGDEAMLVHAALGRPGTAREAAAAVLFFCDPLNTYTTGQMLAVDAGWSVGYGRNF